MSKAAAYRNVQRYQDGQWQAVRRAIPEEAPVVIAPNGSPFAAVMASPINLEDLALGFAVTEGLVENVSEISGLEVVAVDEGYEARLIIPAARSARLEDRRRAFAARTSCSLCGLEGLDSLLTRRPNARAEPIAFAPESILAAMAAMPAAQRLNAETHSTHAAGWIDQHGQLLRVREDVGRHNALDKLLGGLMRDGHDLSAGSICLTSRCSIEMVLKAAVVGVPLIAAASSPTELAVRAAEAAGIVLIACVKDGAFEIYAGGEWLEDAA